MRRETTGLLLHGFALALALLSALSARAADILLDEPVRLSQVICFPSRADANRFYYAPVVARLARHPNGKPQFSFLRYVENVRSEAGADDAREGAGGGIVHAVVRLGLTDGEVEAARRELASIRPGGSLEGPVIFNSGTFALISSFKPENAELVRQLVGVGEAPIIEGTQAAISLALTKKGAQVLWESFHTTTPDISFLFTLELDGFRSPKQATLEADFDEIYKHRSFHEKLDLNALAEAGAAIPVDEIVQGVALASGAPIPPGVLPNLDVGIKARAGGYLQSEIDNVFDDLRESGAIRITYVGEDAALQNVITEAYTQLRDVIFSPAKRLPGISGDTAAVKKRDAPKREKKPAKRHSKVGVQDGAEADAGNATPPKTDAAQPEASQSAKGESQEGASEAKKEGGADKTETAAAGATAAKPEGDSKETAPKDEGKSDAGKASGEATSPTDPAKAFADSLFKKPQPNPQTPSPVKPKQGNCAGYDPGQSFSGLAQLSFALDACLTTKYQFKNQRQRGRYLLDLRKYSASTLRVPFAENIGDLTEHLADSEVFRSVNLDDPLYRQREIATALNGVTLADFGPVLNSVAVQLRKRHAQGDTTFEEVRIDRAAFERRGSDYKLLYGWKGDDDRAQWLEYDYRVLWSFAGGHQVETPWQTGTFSVVPLDPPFARRALQLEASPETLKAAGVRLITVRVYQKLGGAESVRQATLRADQGDASRRLELLTPTGELAYEYEIDWRLSGGRKLGSGRISTTEDVIFVDELPE